ncbi:MAG: hypothetical protein B7Z83_03165 [Thiomonas sp. 20-64-5]|nr:MAG: hypothetical protein B7Z83_03165 [Thiomonas sp. 20-64-5]
MRWRMLLCAGWLISGWIGSAQAALLPSQPPPICLSQPGSAACAAQTRQDLNARMNHLYRREMQKVMGTDAERRLDHAQNLWRRWANADCLFRNGPQDRGGPPWQIRQDACLSDKIRNRIAQLVVYLHCVGNICPPG